MPQKPFEKLTVSRRALMKTFAGIAGAASFRGLLREAFSQSAPQYPRFAVLSNPHGCAPKYWSPQAPGGGAAGVTGWTLDFDPDASMGPLEKHKSSLVIMEGLDLSCNFTEGALYTGHDGGAVAPLTGLHSRSPENPDSMRTTGPSIDYFLAKRFGVEPFLFYQTGYDGYDLFITFNDTGERVPNEFELDKSLGKWFGSFMGQTPAMPDPKAAARTAADLAVMDYLNADAKKLRTRLAAPERMKLDAHVDALNLIRSRITGTSSPPPLVACQKPATSYPSTLDMETATGTILQFVAELFACNLTRVATMDLSPSRGKMPWLLGNLDSHDDVAHGYRPDNDASARTLSKLQRWYAQQVASFIDLLKAIPEGNGTVYDNTIILWSNELGDPARHMNNNLPFVLAGGGGTYPKGRYLKYSTGSEYADTQAPHGPLLTSLANQYGANLTVYGDPKYPGELPGLAG
jgi:hypothetical protein